MKRLLPWIAFAIAVPASAATPLEVSALMTWLASTPEVQSPFTERKHSPLLAAPLDSAGTLSYRRPDVVEKTVTMPRRERFRILADEVVVERSGKEQRIALSSQPVLAAFAASLRGVLSGDAAALRKYFKLQASGDEGAWTLELTPSDNVVARYVERIVVAGSGGRVQRIETFETTGDRTVTQIP